MQVLVSGQAGLFAIKTATGYTVERVDTGETFNAGPREIAYYFAGCSDVDACSARDAGEARKRAGLAWHADRAVRLFVILLDPEEDPADLVEVGEALDELLSTPKVVEIVEEQIFSAPLPEPIAVHAVLEALSGAPLSTALLERFLTLQGPIARVRNAYDEISDAAFENRRARERFFELAIDRGSVRALVQAAASAGKVDAALFDLYSDLRGLENYRAIIQQWTSSFERQHHSYTIDAEPDERFDHVVDQPGAGGRQAFERALQQQSAIVDRIRAADFDTARRFARDLIAEQRRSSDPEHIAKSLSSISQKAKALDALELALEWGQQAVEIKPDDAIAHAHLADLLMRVGRYLEAHHSLDLAQSFGETDFAASGRARILRYQGQFAEALAAYRQAAENRGTDDPDGNFNLAGIAECLRDMENFGEALAAYDDAIAKYQYDTALLSGRAATLVDLGRYDEALAGYRDALRLDDHNVVPRNGIASLFRKAGEFDDAEQQYRDIIVDYPLDAHSRGGLVGTLRELGRFDEAVAQARELIARIPASPDAMWILADALIDAGHFDEATSSLKLANQDHRHVAGLRTALARIEKAKGNYAEALALYDDAARDFPSSAWIQDGRADMLRRLGNTDEALRIYERSFEKHPHRLSLRNAIASIYIRQKRFNDALALLHIDDPRNADEWRNFALRGMLDSSAGSIDSAEERFAWGIERCPFRKERRMLRGALTRLQLQRGRLAAAIEVSQECVGDITELMKFHANATLTDKGPARELYGRLLESNLPQPYHELRDEIAANCNVVVLRPRRNIAWILAHEEDGLLLEAA